MHYSVAYNERSTYFFSDNTTGHFSETSDTQMWNLLLPCTTVVMLYKQSVKAIYLYQIHSDSNKDF